MEGKNILVTGGAGSIGSQLVRKLCENNNVFVYDINETALFDLIEELGINGVVADIRNKSDLIQVFDLWKPDIVFHAAALKHVTPSRWNPELYVDVNIKGTENVIRIAQDRYCRVVNISTDKVVNPESIMGATKKVAELIVKNSGVGISVRFGNVLGSRGSVIPIWQKQIDDNKPLTVTSAEMERFFMTIEEACDLVIKAGEEGNEGEIFILDMGKPINILNLAKDILKKSGKDLNIKLIGSRPGENLTEDLMTDAEKKVAIKQDRYYIIR